MGVLEVIINSHGHPLGETFNVPKDVTLKFSATQQHVCNIDSWGSALNQVDVLRRASIGEKIKHPNDDVENYRITFGVNIESNPMNVFVKTVNVYGEESWNPLYTEEEKRASDAGQITLRDIIYHDRIRKDGEQTTIYCLFCRGTEGSSRDITMDGVDLDNIGDFDFYMGNDMGNDMDFDMGSFGIGGGERVRKKTKRKKYKEKKKKSKSRRRSSKKTKRKKYKMKRKIRRNHKSKSKA